MNVVVQILQEYFHQEYILTLGLIFLSLVVSTIQANGISFISASIIDGVELGNRKASNHFFIQFCIISMLFIYVYYTYKSLQTKLLTKLRQWIKYKLVGLLLKSNNENMSEMNFSKVSSPINRISSVCFMLFTDLFSGMLPTLAFTFSVCLYLLYTNVKLGLLFLFGNFIVFAWIWWNWNSMFDKNAEYEKYTVENESYLLEILNNIDKIIFRGQVNDEVKIFRDKTVMAIEKAIDFYFSVEHSGLWLNLIVSLIVIMCIWYSIQDVFSKKINKVFFISFMTMILLYRDKMISFVQMVPDFVEFIGRTKSVLKHFKDIEYKDYSSPSSGGISQLFKQVNLPFEKIELEQLEFKYKGSDVPLFQNMNLVINTKDHSIIGITGMSGKGKSTVMKLLLKLHVPSHGKIMIDGVDIKDLDPNYIRQNITYVNQTGKLFDRKVIDNIMYGCSASEVCKKQLEIIMKYPKVNDLFKEIDIFKKQSGSLGENLSGGQRQVVNIIGGLINPAKILILDEPTNALDANLKKEIIQIIKDFRVFKNAIIIITHDKEVFPIMDENIKL